MDKALDIQEITKLLPHRYPFIMIDRILELAPGEKVIALKDSLIYFMGMDKVKFRKPVTPGDQLIFEMKFIKQRRNVFKMFGTAYVDKNVVAQAELMATFGEGK